MKKEIFTRNSLVHIKWNCKYHIVFAPKYRRKVFFDDKRQEIRDILRTLCKRKGVEIIEGEVCPDHIHLLLYIPPKISVSGFMWYLKGKSSLMIFDRHANLKHKYGNKHFWCRGYYVDTVGRNKQKIVELDIYFKKTIRIYNISTIICIISRQILIFANIIVICEY